MNRDLKDRRPSRTVQLRFAHLIGIRFCNFWLRSNLLFGRFISQMLQLTLLHPSAAGKLDVGVLQIQRSCGSLRKFLKIVRISVTNYEGSRFDMKPLQTLDSTTWGE